MIHGRPYRQKKKKVPWHVCAAVQKKKKDYGLPTGAICFYRSGANKGQGEGFPHYIGGVHEGAGPLVKQSAWAF